MKTADTSTVFTRIIPSNKKVYHFKSKSYKGFSGVLGSTRLKN
jgi:hypothetical protein